MATASPITIRTKHISPSISDSSLPSLVLQVTHLVDSCMIWIGTTELSSEDADKAPFQGALCRDWACAMPRDSAVSATSLFRSSDSDVALSMSQRLARRFGKQIFLSVDLPPAFMALGEGPRLLFEVEKGVVEVLKESGTPVPT